MARQKKIVDASVAVKWFLHETSSDHALRLLDEHRTEETYLVVPDFIFLEILNALRYKNHDKEKLAEVNLFLWDLGLHTEKINQFLLDKASAIALKYNLTLYDATYAALAEIYGCSLITADKELAKTPNAVII